jgi:hypothetical protein
MDANSVELRMASGIRFSSFSSLSMRSASRFPRLFSSLSQSASSGRFQLDLA